MVVFEFSVLVLLGAGLAYWSASGIVASKPGLSRYTRRMCRAEWLNITYNASTVPAAWLMEPHEKNHANRVAAVKFLIHRLE